MGSSLSNTVMLLGSHAMCLPSGQGKTTSLQTDLCKFSLNKRVNPDSQSYKYPTPVNHLLIM